MLILILELGLRMHYIITQSMTCNKVGEDYIWFLRKSKLSTISQIDNVEQSGNYLCGGGGRLIGWRGAARIIMLNYSSVTVNWRVSVITTKPSLSPLCFNEPGVSDKKIVTEKGDPS